MQQLKTDRYSQDYVLQERMFEAHLRHGDRVLADVGPIRIENYKGGAPHAYFCPMGVESIKIKQNLQHGDGKPLPEEAKVINVLTSDGEYRGYYMLRNVILYSNGTLQVIGNEQTVIERYIEPEVLTF